MASKKKRMSVKTWSVHISKGNFLWVCWNIFSAIILYEEKKNRPATGAYPSRRQVKKHNHSGEYQ
jgi:hypothetical protein